MQTGWKALARLLSLRKLPFHPRVGLCCAQRTPSNRKHYHHLGRAEEGRKLWIWFASSLYNKCTDPWSLSPLRTILWGLTTIGMVTVPEILAVAAPHLLWLFLGICSLSYNDKLIHRGLGGSWCLSWLGPALQQSIILRHKEAAPEGVFLANPGSFLLFSFSQQNPAPSPDESTSLVGCSRDCVKDANSLGGWLSTCPYQLSMFL